MEVALKEKAILVLILLSLLCSPAFGQTSAIDWYNKGNVLYNQSKYDEAIRAYDKAIEINPQYAQAIEDKGFALYKEGNYKDAIKAYDRVIEINPQYVLAWNNKGTALFDEGRYEDAIKAYDKAINLTPADPDIWANKGNSLYELHNYTEAIKCYDKTFNLDPIRHAFILYTKESALRALGRIPEANAVHDQALSFSFLSSSSKFAGEPTYTLETQASANQIDPGKNFTLGIYIEGAGDVDYSKLRVNIPPYIVQNGTLVYKVYMFNFSDKPYSINQGDPLFLVNIPGIYFKSNETINKILLNDTNPLSNTGGLATHNGFPPIIINFTMSSKAPPGDHLIYIDLFYKNNGKWYVDKQDIPLHIKYWYEQERLQDLASFALISGIIIALIELCKFFSHDYKWSYKWLIALITLALVILWLRTKYI